jgi:monoamine oxidase
MLDRRGWLMGSGALAASLAGGPFPARAAESDVIVIGAGAAGIAAAKQLQAAGRQAIVLEARGRLGGRTFTDSSLGPAYDAGAMFIHWAERNPWTEIARELGVATPNESWGGGFQLFQSGKPMPAGDRARRRGAFGEIDRRLETADLQSRDLSVAELLSDLGPDLAPVAASGLLLSIGEESARISARDYQRLWSGEDYVVPSGYGNLVARYGAGLDIRLNQPVTAIDWSGSRVAVTTASGTLRARACIVTVPVGVLKAGGIRFTPELPMRTRDALAGIGMGALTKIALKVEGDRFGIAPGTTYFEAGAAGRLISFELFPDDRDLVIGYCGGDFARDLSNAGPGAAREQVVDLLAAMIGSEFRKAAGPISFPAWWTDPFSHGSYSVCLPGHANARDILAEPIGGKLWLAGEATAGGGAMTAGGATLAGRTAAAAVARLKA